MFAPGKRGQTWGQCGVWSPPGSRWGWSSFVACRGQSQAKDSVEGLGQGGPEPPCQRTTGLDGGLEGGAHVPSGRIVHSCSTRHTAAGPQRTPKVSSAWLWYQAWGGKVAMVIGCLGCQPAMTDPRALENSLPRTQKSWGSGYSYKGCSQVFCFTGLGQLADHAFLGWAASTRQGALDTGAFDKNHFVELDEKRIHTVPRWPRPHNQMAAAL